MSIGFAVIYRWRLRDSAESEFRAAWEAITLALRRERGALGSRLHRAEDGTWVAYAQWPDRESWEASGRADSLLPEASAAMAAATLESFPPLLLDPVSDYLVTD